MIIAEAVALATPMPISILALILLSAWIYPSFYLASRIKDNPSVPRRYKPTVQVVSLFAGPAVFLTLVVMNKQQFDKHVNPLVNLIDRAQNTLSNFWHGGQEPEAEDDNMLRLFDSTGAELSEIYGHVDRRSGDGKCLDLTARIIDNALKLRASDILIDPQDRSSYAVRLRIDGALRTVQEIPIDTCKIRHLTQWQGVAGVRDHQHSLDPLPVRTSRSWSGPPVHTKPSKT